MKIISSYGVELRKQNIPIRQTLEIYRSAVRYLVEVYESVWEELAQIEESKKRFNAAEHLVHTTKRNPARFDFDFCFPKMPSYFRRAAVQHALGSVSSYRTRLEQWKAEGQKTGKPYLKSEQYAMPVFYHDVMYRENTEEKDAAFLKLYDGHDWKWFAVRLKHTDMEYLRKHWSGKKASAPTLEKKHDKYFLRFTYAEEVSLNRTPVKEQTICSVDLGINTDAVCTIMRPDGTILGRKFINFPSDKDRMYRVLDSKISAGTWIASGAGKMGICKTSEYRAWQKNCKGNRSVCVRKEGRCDCFRISGNERKTFREEKAETADVEKT